MSLTSNEDEYFISYIIQLVKSISKNGVKKLHGMIEAEMFQRDYDTEID